MKRLQILGGGCAKCHELAERTQAAATALGLDFGMEKVSDLKQIMGFGVLRTPALVVDGIDAGQMGVRGAGDPWRDLADLLRAKLKRERAYA